ncbi:Protein CBG06396 [Caenorhabditis briggsae]|uniref:Serpentine receptor class r-10 n=1 Tax=Caenorhabditis briggsae TaxID=6238 RepID=A8X250_CAEBR|nr:Protein CBG06396 [Caenorhabditis briggsae]CAP26710.1 Protein CBG06396 [Caenorhabditis briggsae]
MLTVSNWKTFIELIQFGGGAIGVFLNFSLILLTYFRSPPHLGAYKYLMYYISGFEILYAILNAIVQGHLFSHGPAFIFFRNLKHSYFGRAKGFYLLVAYCGSFGLSIALFGVHFIYRYGAVDNVFRKKFLGGKKLLMLFLLPIFYCVWWCLVVIICYRSSSKSDDFMRIPFLENYDTRVEEISYVMIWFHIANDEGILEPRWPTFIGIANLWFMVTSSFVCVIFFGIKCYRKITKALKHSKMSSYYARSIQKQLFQALVLQTLVPVVLMYGPVGILYMFPMLNIEVGFISTFVTATVEVYPAVDPLPTMFIVDNFRKTILCKNKRKIEDLVKSGDQSQNSLSKSFRWLPEPKQEGGSSRIAESGQSCFLLLATCISVIPTVTS